NVLERYRMVCRINPLTIHIEGQLARSTTPGRRDVMPVPFFPSCCRRTDAAFDVVFHGRSFRVISPYHEPEVLGSVDRNQNPIVIFPAGLEKRTIHIVLAIPIGLDPELHRAFTGFGEDRSGKLETSGSPNTKTLAQDPFFVSDTRCGKAFVPGGIVD